MGELDRPDDCENVKSCGQYDEGMNDEEEFVEEEN